MIIWRDTIFRVVVLRRMLRVSWLDRKSNDIVLERAGADRSLIAKRQLPFFLAIYVEA